MRPPLADGLTLEAFEEVDQPATTALRELLTGPVSETPRAVVATQVVSRGAASVLLGSVAETAEGVAQIGRRFSAGGSPMVAAVPALMNARKPQPKHQPVTAPPNPA